jgi:3-oxoacyl-[acyl-carrier-protein] synthase-3
MPHSIITGTGSYIPSVKIPNRYFLGHQFFRPDGVKIKKSNIDIIDKLEEITCISERRYASDDLNTSDIAFMAAERALEHTDRETIDYIIVAHNLGDIRAGSRRSDMVPPVASRVKYRLKIKNPYTVAFDIPFGCPGWIHGMILADYYIRSGDVKKVLVIGAEVLSRVTDPHDVDSMIFSDGAGAVLVEATGRSVGILSHVTRSDTIEHAYLLRTGRSYNPDFSGDDLFVKMDGHEIYKYAVRTVPHAVKESLDKAGFTLTDVKKVFIHQANQKMDEAILERLFKLYQIKNIPDNIMPMTISWLGNSSVATIPTMFDLVQRGKLDKHKLHPGDIVVFASVGAGMNINSLVYRMP